MDAPLYLESLRLQLLAPLPQRLRALVDDLITAQVLGRLHLVRRPNNTDHVALRNLTHLNQETSNTTGSCKPNKRWREKRRILLMNAESFEWWVVIGDDQALTAFLNVTGEDISSGFEWSRTLERMFLFMKVVNEVSKEYGHLVIREVKVFTTQDQTWKFRYKHQYATNSRREVTNEWTRHGATGAITNRRIPHRLANKLHSNGDNSPICFYTSRSNILTALRSEEDSMTKKLWIVLSMRDRWIPVQMGEGQHSPEWMRTLAPGRGWTSSKMA